ncbi:hypothetical protein EXIGLDRAFT_473611 [Exidia glandulosa HHB12029]|uniref:Uncharacterized protein n=1 Tax=Exidia glandulosa HHB12029 TaxID=1314781 RepID=A0A165ASM1_EXIGL|nr:hypothetical protein EXIGLDRAFT_473611 [Exidia glandulosa HHB12029]
MSTSSISFSVFVTARATQRRQLFIRQNRHMGASGRVQFGAQARPSRSAVNPESKTRMPRAPPFSAPSALERSPYPRRGLFSAYSYAFHPAVSYSLYNCSSGVLQDLGRRCRGVQTGRLHITPASTACGGHVWTVGVALDESRHLDTLNFVLGLRKPRQAHAPPHETSPRRLQHPRPTEMLSANLELVAAACASVLATWTRDDKFPRVAVGLDARYSHPMRQGRQDSQRQGRLSA